MDNEVTFTKEDSIFFMDMVGSCLSPNYVPQLPHKKPYNKILKDRNSTEYKRFIHIYKAIRHILSERERIILDEVYGVNGVKSSLRVAGEKINISPERVRQIRNKAENKLAVGIVKRRKKD